MSGQAAGFRLARKSARRQRWFCMEFPAGYPRLETARLSLRPLAPADARDVQRLAGDAEVAATTANLPHPYPDGMAEAWIATHADLWRDRKGVVLGITLKATGELVGCTGLHFEVAHEKAELGYWIGRPHWGRGYASEAARALVEFGFGVLQLHRIQAHYMAHNPASGRVMENAGLRREGRSPGAMRKHGRFVDLVFHGAVRPGATPDAAE
jgi:[ribosomal protein S5]-alanine N-acetyltransferase